VNYFKEGFTAANKDTLVADLLNVLKASGSKLMKVLFPADEDSDQVRREKDDMLLYASCCFLFFPYACS
jgi:myosin heavy subunit